MKGEFVTYEVAKRLKGLGFDSPCYAFYQEETIEGSPCMVDDDDEYRRTGFRTCVNSEIPDHYAGAPLRQQAFGWFRDQHNLYGEILMDRTTSPKWAFEIHRYEDFGNYEKSEEKEWSLYRTYEEAEEDCLKRLCSIIESEGAQGA